MQPWQPGWDLLKITASFSPLCSYSLKIFESFHKKNMHTGKRGQIRHFWDWRQLQSAFWCAILYSSCFWFLWEQVWRLHRVQSYCKLSQIPIYFGSFLEILIENYLYVQIFTESWVHILVHMFGVCITVYIVNWILQNLVTLFKLSF